MAYRDEFEKIIEQTNVLDRKVTTALKYYIDRYPDMDLGNGIIIGDIDLSSFDTGVKILIHEQIRKNLDEG